MKTEQPIVLKGWSQGEMAERLAEGILVKRDTITMDEFKVNTKEWLIDKLESMNKEDALKAICNLHDELNKPQYPKTYEECCKLLNKATFISFEGLSLGEVERYKPYIKLCRCRDAYWKTVGERMGLGEPWKPDWEDGRPKYGLIVSGNRVKKQKSEYVQMKFCFPTEEILDAFCENFDKPINNCKEIV